MNDITNNSNFSSYNQVAYGKQQTMSDHFGKDSTKSEPPTLPKTPKAIPFEYKG
jgi:hypothetical protein